MSQASADGAFNPGTPTDSALNDAAFNSSRAWLGVCAAAVSIFLFVADSALTAISLPAIERTFSSWPRSAVGWVASSFVVAQASMLLVAGQLGDRRGRKQYYLIGLGMYTAGALCVATAPVLPMIIGARIIQGFGAAFLTSGALPLVLPLFPEAKAPRVIGTWGAIGSVAAWLTPTVGGALVDWNWRFAYGAIVPIGVGAFVLGLRVLPEQAPEVKNRLRIDRLGILFGPPGFGLAMLVLSQGRRWGWTNRSTLQLGAAATLLIAVFLFRCARHPSPLLDLALFRNREFSANVAGGMLQQVGFFSFFITAPLIMTQVWGWSARQAGLGLALSQILATVGSLSAGRLVEIVGPYPILIMGALINSAGSLWLVITATVSVSFWSGYVPAALMLGFGASWCGTVTSGSGLAALSRDALGLGNSAQQLLRRAGGSVGVALAVALLGDGRGADLLPGAKRVWWMGVIVHLLIGIPMLFVPQPFARRRRTARAELSTTS